ncbi:hypothetical protein ACIRRA_15210 [Nocardia sp. NPDC101769]|uniref:hypothetical protein n=1 Tax=Nocardia sp. NPDC101769 TaxID=3364333 RepID=UPI0038128D78
MLEYLIAQIRCGGVEGQCAPDSFPEEVVAALAYGNSVALADQSLHGLLGERSAVAGGGRGIEVGDTEFGVVSAMSGNMIDLGQQVARDGPSVRRLFIESLLRPQFQPAAQIHVAGGCRGHGHIGM